MYKIDLTSIYYQALLSTFPIYILDSDMEKSIGNGFFISKDKKVFLVTNKHVVENSIVGRILFNKAKNGLPVINEKVEAIFKDFSNLWTFPCDSKIDLAICPLELLLGDIKEDFFYTSINTKSFLSEENLNDIEAIQEIYYITNQIINENEEPTVLVRKGITSTPIHFDFMNLPCFLADVPLFEGSSGSPVLIMNRGFHNIRNSLRAGDRFILVGITSKTLFDIYEKDDQKKSKFFLDLALVFKPQPLIDLISNAI